MKSYRPNPKKAGKSTFEMSENRRQNGIQIGVILMIAIAIVGLVILPNADKLGIGGSTIVFFFLAILILPRIFEIWSKQKSREWKRAYRGAVAEEKIGDLLSNLGDEFHVIHDVESEYGNIDHIVLNENGSVFLIETKSHHGKVTVENGRILINGHEPEKDFINQTLQNSFWLAKQLQEITGEKIWINPILVFTNAFVTRNNPVKGIAVTNKKYLIDMIHIKTEQARANQNFAQTLNAILTRLENNYSE